MVRKCGRPQRRRSPVRCQRCYSRRGQLQSLTVVSVLDSADIEIDGVFVGDTPSDVQLPEGEHTVAVKKKGFKDWERKMKVMAGSSVHLNAELQTH